MLTLSWIALIVSCLGYGTASVLQSIGARRVATATGLTGLASIAAQLPYLVGLGLDVVAFLTNLIALQELPLFLVQTVLAASIGVTAVLAFLRGAVLTWKDWASLGLLGAGLVLLGLSAAPEAATGISQLADWLILASTLLPVAVLAVGIRLPARPAGLVLAAAAGLGFSGVAVAARGISADRLDRSLLADPLLWTIVLQGGLALVAFALALQRAAVTTVTAVTFIVEVVLPSLVGLLLFGDQVNAGFGLAAVLGFVLAATGMTALMRFAA